MPAQYNHIIDTALAMVREELIRAEKKHGLVFASPHEGHSVIDEERDELWDHVKADTGRTKGAGKEAMQTAAIGRQVHDQLRSEVER